MIKTVVHLPKNVDLPGSLEFSKVLATKVVDGPCEFDFSRVDFVEPFGMLIVSSEIRRLMKRFPAEYSASNYAHMTYAAHMGFFQSFGLQFGNQPGEAKANSRYLPLTRLRCEELKRKAVENGREVGDEVEGESKHLARMLCGEDVGAVFDSLSYSLREMMRNVVEHSEAEDIWLCAQYWPSKARVEVAIVDLGIGVRRSLSGNPHIDPSDDKKAINYALMPAVSGKAFKGARKKQRGPWANSGFGLYMTSRVCRNGGNFFIASGDTGMLLTTKAEAKRYFPCEYQGTAIRMVIKTDRMPSLTDALDTYRREGYEIQRRYSEIVNIDPSSASLMLSEDFDLSVWDRLLAKIKGS